MFQFIPSSVGLLAFLFSSIFLIRILIKKARHRSIAYLPGPKSKSWLIGNFPDIMYSEPSIETECRWINEYGNAICTKGIFGSDVLFLADPKALQFILNTLGYNVRRPQWFIAAIRLITGEGLNVIHGKQHSRQRNVMAPAFQLHALRHFTDALRIPAQQAVTKWNDIISASGGSAEVDVVGWLGRIALDTFGKVAFNYEFGAMDDGYNVLAEEYRNLSSLMLDTAHRGSNFHLTVDALYQYMPYWLVRFLHHVLPFTHLKHLRKYQKVARSFAREIVNKETNAVLLGKPEQSGKNIINLMIQANMSENPKKQVSDEELMEEIITLMFASQGTTKVTISWALYELSKRPDYQEKIREEIKVARKPAADRGNLEPEGVDLDSVKYLTAVLKETLRLHPPFQFLRRESTIDLVIPLSSPVKSKTGETIINIPVSAGQEMLLCISAYNRLKSIWGEDADTFKPERFLGDLSARQTTKLGVISNLGTFGSGFKSCLAWRYAMMEMQIILVELLTNFEFSRRSLDKVVSGAAWIVSPKLKSDTSRVQLPLLISPVQDRDRQP